MLYILGLCSRIDHSVCEVSMQVVVVFYFTHVIFCFYFL